MRTASQRNPGPLQAESPDHFDQNPHSGHRDSLSDIRKPPWTRAKRMIRTEFNQVAIQIRGKFSPSWRISTSSYTLLPRPLNSRKRPFPELPDFVSGIEEGA